MSAQPAPPTGTDGYFTLEGQRIYCKQYKPSKDSGVTVILLHGAAFTSQNWEDIETLSFLADEGILAFAIDLPGFGKSKEAKVSDRGEFLKGVVDYVKGDVKVIVSPSMSGSFSIPYINSYGDEIDGYVPVAPVGVGNLAPSTKVGKTLPLLAVAGENDRGGVAGIATFEMKFKKVDKLIIADGSHPAYLDDPDLFNTKLSEFAMSLKK